jgi:hypothetical protein
VSRKAVAPIRIALSIPEAAATLGFSESYFRAEILPHLPVIPGTRPRVLVSDLEIWAEERKVQPTAPLVGSGRSAFVTADAGTSTRRASKSSREKSERVRRLLQRAGRA